MRKKFREGTEKPRKSMLKSILPVGSIVGTGKLIKDKIKKNKEDKKSRNPNPKTPKMMGSDTPKKKTIKKYQKFTEANLDNLRQAGYSEDFLSLEEGLKKYFDQLSSSNGFYL